LLTLRHYFLSPFFIDTSSIRYFVFDYFRPSAITAAILRRFSRLFAIAYCHRCHFAFAALAPRMTTIRTPFSRLPLPFRLPQRRLQAAAIRRHFRRH
jgi:hypothetical protein